MHFDDFVSYFSAKEIHLPVDEGQLLKKKYLQKSNSTHAYILFPPWGQKLIFFAPLSYYISKKGYPCLSYEISKAVLTSDLKQMDFYMHCLVQKVDSDLSFLKKTGFTSFTFIGTSIGSMLAIYFANKYAESTKLILNTPGNCQAEIIWQSPRLRVIKNSLIRQGYDMEKLKQIWKEYIPEYNLDNLHSKEICINLSRADRVVPYACGLKLIGKMIEKGLSPRVNENKNLGHYLTAASYYLKPNFL